MMSGGPTSQNSQHGITVNFAKCLTFPIQVFIFCNCLIIWICGGTDFTKSICQDQDRLGHRSQATDPDPRHVIGQDGYIDQLYA